MLNAANGIRREVIDYGEDPIAPSRGLVADALARLHGWLVPAYAGGDVDPGGQFFGYGPPLQNFRGAANPAATLVTYRDGDYAELSSAEVAGTMGDPARRIFADRLRRGRVGL